MISKKTFQEMKLKSVAAVCAKCGTKHEKASPVDREGMRGVLCGHCFNILWMTSIRHIYIPPTEPNQSKEELIALTERQERDFLDTLPECPYCNTHQWESFLESIKFPPDCRNCGNPFKGEEFRDNSAQRAFEVAYWYKQDKA